MAPPVKASLTARATARRRARAHACCWVALLWDYTGRVHPAARAHQSSRRSWQQAAHGTVGRGVADVVLAARCAAPGPTSTLMLSSTVGDDKRSGSARWQVRLSHARAVIGASAADTHPAAAALVGGHRQAADIPRLIHEMSIRELQHSMARGEVTCAAATAHFCSRIEAFSYRGPRLNAVVEVNPDAETLAAASDRERAAGYVRGPMHGICVLIKENIDTDDRMLTTAGSLALLSSRPAADARLVSRLREAGAIILGKTNLSEWANFRSSESRSGWSARGGQTRNPHVLDRSPCGSSAGSAVAVASGLCTVAVGTETNGSIVCPASVCGVVGLKPTTGLVPGDGIIPLSRRQDTAGPLGRSVADVTELLSVLACSSGYADSLADFVQLDAGIVGRRVGVVPASELGVTSPAAITACESVISQLRLAGATVVDISTLRAPSSEASHEATDAFEKGHGISDQEFGALLVDFERDIKAYLCKRLPRKIEGSCNHEAIPRSLDDLITFNHERTAQELQHFGQDIFELARDRARSTSARVHDTNVTAIETHANETLHGTMDDNNVDVLICPTCGPAWPIVPKDNFCGGLCSALAAVAGGPLITLPAGDWQGLPLGVTLMGRRFSEKVILEVASVIEQRLPEAGKPHFVASIGEQVEGTAP
eukprot:COSAG02_NODE_7542_length_2968_cov_4.422098_1_plen_656_part_00